MECGYGIRTAWVFNGLHMHPGNLPRLSYAKSRSISPENFTGDKGRGGMAAAGTGSEAAAGLGAGWEINPFIFIDPQATVTLADIRAPSSTSG